MTTIQIRRDAIALVSWLQTFPEVVTPIVPIDNDDDDESFEQILKQLNLPEVALDVSKVAEIICGVSVDSTVAQSPLKTNETEININHGSGTDLLWQSLLTMSAAKARPLQKGVQFHCDKVLVLSHLLDCAVQVSDKQQRRTYIGRIMTLKKSTQKTIMTLIESRASHNNHSNSKSPTKHVVASKHTNSKTLPYTPQSDKSGSSKQSSRQRNARITSPLGTNNTPMGLFTTASSPFQSTKQTTEAVISRMNCTGAANTTTSIVESVRTPQIKQSNTSTPIKSSLRKSSAAPSSSRGHNVAFGSPLSSSSNNLFNTSIASPHQPSFVDPGFLSPGTMESPNRLQLIILKLQQQNESLQCKVLDFQNQENEMKKKLELLEVVHRQKMMSVEAHSIERIQDIARESEERITTLQNQLLEAQELSSQGSIAMKELKAAKDELEMMNHSKSVLVETTDKLRKYKEKVTELQDVKEALCKEQEAHGQAVDEIIRLENEVQQLQPVRRQVEDYRIRAIEAEVKLVECQDYLRRIERQCNDQNTKNEHLYQDVIMQRDQMEELQRRIQDDTQQAMDTDIKGIGDGISELNPELKEELIRLRNENLQLRAFQAKRTEDAVQYLEESLDDCKRLAERYKGEFLRTKDDLGSTVASLQESVQRETELNNEVRNLRDHCHNLEQQITSMQSQLKESEIHLLQTKEIVVDTEERCSKLDEEIKVWITKMNQSETISKERLHKLNDTMNELEQTQYSLQTTQDEVEQLRSNKIILQGKVNEGEKCRTQIQSDLEKATWELQESQKHFLHKSSEYETLQRQNDNLQKQISGLEEVVRVERTQRKEDAIEAQKSLDTTRQLLEMKNKKEIEEIHTNMSILLDDERKANRKKDEDSKRIVAQLEQDWQQKYTELQERSTSALQNSRQQAQEQLDFIKHEHKNDIATMKQEWEAHVANVKRESNENLDNFIRKGKEKVKIMQANVQEEMQRLDDERRDIEERYEKLEKLSSDTEQRLQDQIVSLKQQLEFTNGQINDHIREAGEYQDLIKSLTRDKFKLNDENEQYRRQLGGRYGSDGHIHLQLEKLQKEYNDIVEENRKLKKHSESSLDVIQESGEDEGTNRSYRRGGGVDRKALMQMQKDFERRIDALNDEKRDLIMKMSSQATDVHKAEKKAWESEEVNTKLRAEIISLRLSLQRIESASDNQFENRSFNENRSPMETSFHSTQQNTSNSTPIKGDSPGQRIVRSSPGIDRAKKQKMEQENNLRNRFSHMTGTPPRATTQQLTTSPEHNANVLSAAYIGNYNLQAINESEIDALTDTASGSTSPTIQHSSPKSPSKISKMASDVFRLGLTKSSPRTYPEKSNFMRISGTHSEQPLSSLPHALAPNQLDDNHQECNQS